MWNIEYMRVIKKDEAIKIHTISLMRGQGEVSTSCGSECLQSACSYDFKLERRVQIAVATERVFERRSGAIFDCTGGKRGLNRWTVKLSPCHPELVSGSDQPQIPKQVRNDNLSRRCLCLV